MNDNVNNTVKAMQRYHQHFDGQDYNTVAALLAESLKVDREDKLVVAGMILLQDTAFGLCGHPDFVHAWHALAVFCGHSAISCHVVDAMRDFLRPFDQDDTRIDDFESTARAMLIGYRSLDEVRTAVAHANGVHSWQGRMAYELLSAAELLIQTAVLLLAHEDEGYIREKLSRGLKRITGALYEGIRHSEKPALYNFKSTYFPDERDL